MLAAIVGALAAYRFLAGGCPIRMLLGWPCPACGMFRSAAALLRLDLRASLRYHPLTVPFGLALWFALHRNLFNIGKKTKDAILIAAAAAAFAVYLVRLIMGNIP